MRFRIRSFYLFENLLRRRCCWCTLLHFFVLKELDCLAMLRSSNFIILYTRLYRDSPLHVELWQVILVLDHIVA